MAGPALSAALLALPGSWLGTRTAMLLGTRVMQYKKESSSALLREGPG